MEVSVSVLMITYNHEPFIAQAIDGVLMQKTTFQIELVIGEDCSTDRTREICIAYQAKYPNIIKLKLPERNLGMMPNFIQTLNYCTGKYIALCEGDDYWTDPYKLQKQVNFLEKNSDVMLCFTNSFVLNDSNKQTKKWPIILENRVYDPQEIMFDLVVPTCSAVFRKPDFSILKKRLRNPNYIFGDIILWLTLADYGKIFCINEPMVVYRKNDGSAAFSLGIDKLIKLYNQHETISLDFDGKYRLFENRLLSRSYFILAIKLLVKCDLKSFYFLKKSIQKRPIQLFYNILYLFKRMFSSSRKI